MHARRLGAGKRSIRYKRIECCKSTQFDEVIAEKMGGERSHRDVDFMLAWLGGSKLLT
jgi:hypothetical protein